MVVAVGADDAPGRFDVREVAELLPDLLPAPGNRRHRAVFLEVEEHLLDLLVDGGRQQPERFHARLLRGEVGIAGVRCEHDMHRARDLAETTGLREERVRIAREALERERPAVGLPRHEALEDAERRVQQAAGVRVPAEERRDVRKAPLGEEAEQLQLRVHARLETPVGLEDQLVTEDDGGVGLLGAERSRLELGGAGGETVHQPELQRALLPLDVAGPAHELEELCGEERVGQRVVDSPAVRLGHDRVAPALILRAEPEEQLVELVRPGLEAHLHQDGHEKRRGRSQGDGRERAHLEDVARLRPEPAAAEDELVQRILRDEAEVPRRHLALDLIHRRPPRAAGTRRTPVGRT